MAKPKKNNTTRIVFAVITLLVLAVAVTYLLLNQRNSTNYSPYASRDLGSAATACEQKIDQYIGRSLLHRRYDDISSRYEASKKRYVIYYRLSVKSDNDTIEQLAKCVIWESRGYVTGFEVIDI